jgi:hypothetical protein
MTRFLLDAPAAFLMCAIVFTAIGCGASGQPQSLTREGTLRPAPPTSEVIERTSTPRPLPTVTPAPVVTAPLIPTPVSQVLAVNEPATSDTPTPVRSNERRIEIRALPGSAQRGETVRLVAQTPPSVHCTATLEGTSDSPGNALGLGTRQSDSNGVNVWNWRVPGDAKAVSSRVIVSCGALKASQSIRIGPP